MSAFTDRWLWRFLSRTSTFEELIDRLNERLRALDQVLDRYANDLEHGPVPGAYYPVQLSYTESGGLTTGVKDLVPTSFDAVVKAVYLFTPAGAGTITVDINNGSNTMLAAPQSVNGSVTLNDPTDFATGIITPPDINLEIDSIDAGTPVHVRAVVILQNVTNVEDQ